MIAKKTDISLIESDEFLYELFIPKQVVLNPATNETTDGFESIDKVSLTQLQSIKRSLDEQLAVIEEKIDAINTAKTAEETPANS